MATHSLKQFASDIRKAAHEVKADNRRTLTMLGMAVSSGIQDMIGTDQPFWAPLSPVTIAIKQRNNWGLNGNPASPLYATGRFHDSISYQLNLAHNTVSVGTDRESALYTEFGTSRMPPRPVFMPATQLTLKRILSTIPHHYLKRFK